MNVCTKEQVEQFERDGYLFLEAALPTDVLDVLNNEFQAWLEESRNHGGPYGVTIDGRPRFDLEPGHCAERPALRRIASPTELSDAYLDVMRSGIAVDVTAQLIGPNIEFNHSKVNSKQPGTATEVRFHQDILFEAHTNDDMLAVLYFLDDVTLQNGAPKLVSGSHHGPLYEHWQRGAFTGTVAPEVAKRAETEAVPCTGPAGSALLMHGRLLHGSAPNLSDRPRTLFISAYRSEDSYPLDTSHIPSEHEGELVRGVRTNRVRCTSLDMAFSEVPTGASFFEQQAADVT
ncbi:MAG: phytanoyl-CoA dioxygenase family protein [Actinomycetota bacterium]|nr:phytanoyl-CoA dioxygenase family protein [Actinomycetota bacterium]